VSSDRGGVSAMANAMQGAKAWARATQRQAVAPGRATFDGRVSARSEDALAATPFELQPSVRIHPGINAQPWERMARRVLQRDGRGSNKTAVLHSGTFEPSNLRTFGPYPEPSNPALGMVRGRRGATPSCLTSVIAIENDVRRGHPPR
jgi:hypothetical protein